MTQNVNLLDVLGNGDPHSLELIRLDENETAVIPFTPNGERVVIHFCKEPEINGYVLCNGNDCLLCRVGKKRDDRILIPVYLPTTDTIGILPVSTSLRPNALLPQLAPILKAGKPMVAFVKREGAKFIVSSRELPKDANGGEASIKRFLGEFEAGHLKLQSVYQCIPNDQLAALSEIAEAMKLKGIKV